MYVCAHFWRVLCMCVCAHVHVGPKRDRVEERGRGEFGIESVPCKESIYANVVLLYSYVCLIKYQPTFLRPHL